MENYTYYETLIKPDFAPPGWLFGPVWSILYLIIAITFGYVIYMWWKGKVRFSVLLPFLLNIVSNALFTPIQFGLENNLLASIDILVVLVTLIWLMVAIWKKYRWVALANIPYLMWVSFATVLQFTVTYLNW